MRILPDKTDSFVFYNIACPSPCINALEGAKLEAQASITKNQPDVVT